MGKSKEVVAITLILCYNEDDNRVEGMNEMNNANNNPTIVGYDAQTGQPIYASAPQGNQPNFGYGQPMGQPIPPQGNMGMNYPNYNNQPMYQAAPPVQQEPPKKNGKAGKIIFLVVLVVAAIALVAVFALKMGKGENKEKSRTLMIYMVGANLESEAGIASADLEAIDYAKMKNDYVNVVLIAGGASQWYNDFVSVGETSIYELTSNGYKKVKEQERKNMGSSEVLSDFLSYAYDHYKADEYDLVFWNHGSGIGGGEVDEIYNDALSIPEYEKGLEASPFNSDNKIETIIFRTCMNGSLEMAGFLKDYADYLVASEEVTVGMRIFDVLDFVNDILPTDSGYDVGLKFIERYKEQVGEIRDYYEGRNDFDYIYSTYSITDLSKITDLEKKVNDFFMSIKPSSNYNTIARVRSNLYQYALNNSGDAYFDMVDLYRLVDGLKELEPKKADAVLKSLQSTVLYNYATNDQSRGMSIYFPYNATMNEQKYQLKLYDEFDSLEGYREFINEFYKLKNSSTGSKNFYTQTNVELGTSSQDADFMLTLTDEEKEQFAKAEYIVFKKEQDGYFQPLYRGKNVTLDGNVLKASIQNRQLKVVSNDGKENYTLLLIEQDETDEYITYTTVVLLEDFSSSEFEDWKMDNATMQLIYDKDTKKIEIGSIILTSEDSTLPSNVMASLEDYTTVAFTNSKYKILDEKGNYTQNWVGNGTLEGIEEKIGEFHFEVADSSDQSDYYGIFVIRDTYNQVYYSKLVKMK